MPALADGAAPVLLCAVPPAARTSDAAAATDQKTDLYLTITSLSESPLLVALSVAGPQLNLGAVGGSGARDVKAQSGLDTGDGAVGVDVPLLVGLPVAGPDDHRRAIGCAAAGGVQ